MDFSEFVSDFAARHGVAGLSAEDDTAALDIDGVPVLLAADGDRLLVTAEIGEPPPDGAAAFADLLLEANLETDAAFAKSRETGRYILVRRLPLAGLDGESFDVALESFVNRTEAWRKLLANYRPAASAAAESQAADSAAIGAGRFLQV